MFLTFDLFDIILCFLVVLFLNNNFIEFEAMPKRGLYPSPSSQSTTDFVLLQE